MARNTIKIKKYSDVVEEMKAAAAITPGFLVEESSAGICRKHSSPSGNAIPMFALEDELQGKTIDEDYSTDDRVQVWIPGRGDMVYALLAVGQNVTVGTFLVSNGDGYLKANSDPDSFGNDDPAKIVGVAVESVNATSAASRIIVRII